MMRAPIAEMASGEGTPRFRRHVGALALFVVLAAVMVNGFVRDPAHLTVGGEGDNFYGMRQLWWMKHALVDLHRSPYFDPESYYPTGNVLARAELFPATSVLAIPMTATFGPVVAYNLAMYLTFVLMGFGTYLWVHQLTGSPGGAIVAGAIAAFLPYRTAHALGHLDITSTHWMPFALFAFERFLADKSRVRAAVLGLSVGLVALSAWYYAYSIAILLPLYALARSRPWRETWDRRWWTGVGIAAVVTGAMVAPFLIPYARLRLEGGLVRSFGEMESWSLNLHAFFMPNRLNPLWSEATIRWFPQDSVQWVERAVTFGYTALALALIGLKGRRRERAMAAVLAVWGASFLIALGPTLHSGDRQVRMPLPLPLAVLASKLLIAAGLEPHAADVLSPQGSPIPLPSAFMYYLVPVTSGMRVMARFGVWTGLMTAALAGWGVARILERTRARFGDGVQRAGGANQRSTTEDTEDTRTERPISQRSLTWKSSLVSGAIVTVLVGSVLVESYSELPVTRVRPRAVDAWLGEQPRGDWSIVELPLQQTRRLVQDYYKTVHQQPTVFSSPADGFRSALFVRRAEALATFPSRAAIEMLRECRVRYVLLTPSQIPTWPALKEKVDATPELSLDREVGGVLVYAVRF